MPRQVKTPDERAEVIRKATSKAKKGYRLNTKTPRKGVTDDEIVVIKDMLISLKLVGYSNSQCAAIVGLSRGQVREIVKDPNFIKRLESLKTKLPEAAVNLGRAYLVESVMAVIHVMRTETDNALVLKAAAEMFDRFGVPKLTRSESKIETPDEPQEEINQSLLEKLRNEPPEVQERIASLHQSFSEGVEAILNEGKEDAASADKD